MQESTGDVRELMRYGTRLVQDRIAGINGLHSPHNTEKTAGQDSLRSDPADANLPPRMPCVPWSRRQETPVTQVPASCL